MGDMTERDWIMALVTYGEHRRDCQLRLREKPRHEQVCDCGFLDLHQRVRDALHTPTKSAVPNGSTP